MLGVQKQTIALEAPKPDFECSCTHPLLSRKVLFNTNAPLLEVRLGDHLGGEKPTSEPTAPTHVFTCSCTHPFLSRKVLFKTDVPFWGLGQGGPGVGKIKFRTESSKTCFCTCSCRLLVLRKGAVPGQLAISWVDCSFSTHSLSLH